MSREIKFRAWDNETKQYKRLHTMNCVNGEPISIATCRPGHRGFIHIRQHHFTLEQYTGLKDKNGKEIYEGDIVKFGDSIAVIMWRDKQAEFGVGWVDYGVEDSLSWQIEIEKTPSEVIGNIHENPELIGDKK